ncbi:MAG TPA: FeoB small GTPase domain-containing protein, partial [Coriobacteriia bacterium]|nr:FeoB small GTPase domain-containing protein [Coriobacteriia bacterium]
MTATLLPTGQDPTAALEAIRTGAVVLALVGNPNVGKSTAFARLTGIGVETAHYPGTTQGVNIAETTASGKRIVIVDLPGTYSLGGDAPEHAVARRALGDLAPDVVLLVLDATNLARNLVLALEVLDTGLPTVVALNLADEAVRGGIEADSNALERELGVPVVRTVARTGVGLDVAIDRALDAVGTTPPTPRYGALLEELLAPVEAAARSCGVRVGRLTPRGLGIRLFEGAPELVSGPAVAIAAAAADARIRAIERSGEPPAVLVARERHARAEAIARATTGEHSRGRRWHKDAWSLTTS